MNRKEQAEQAEANLILLRGNIIGLLMTTDLSCDGALVETTVTAEVDGENFTGDAIVTRGGIRYRVTVDYA